MERGSGGWRSRGRGGGGGGRGRGGGRGGGGYDWRKHVRPSADPAVMDEVRETIRSFLASNATTMEIDCSGEGAEVKNTYRQYCKDMGVGWAKGPRRGTFKMIRFTSADPSMTLWKKVWCFYFRHYCDVDLVNAATAASESNNVVVEANRGDDDDGGMMMKPSSHDVMDDTDFDEAAAILRLKEETTGDDDDEGGSEAVHIDSKKMVLLDSTSDSFDGRRSWTKVRDLLTDIKRSDDQLWEECRSLGVNNCSERKLEPHMERVQKFFDLQGNGPNQKIRGKKMRVEVGSDESVHFLDGGEGEGSFVVEYAKPVKYGDVATLNGLIRLVDRANRSLGAAEDGDGSHQKGRRPGVIDDKHDIPPNSFNDTWRRTRRNFELGERLHDDNMDPVYQERRDNLRKRLPAFGVGDDFCKRVFENDVVVLCGATGCGKTTQLPQMLMEAAAKLMHEQAASSAPSSSSSENDDDDEKKRRRSFGTGRIICTQPRRISATSVAERVCYERNEKVGDRCGYQIRFEQRASDSTELLYCTTGILLRFLVNNPKLEGVSCVIIDEVHERGVHTDFVLLILKDLVLERQGTAEPLKIVLMSATIDATNFLRYFDRNCGIEFNNMSTDGIGNKMETTNVDDVFAGSSGPDVVSSSGPFSVSFLQMEGRTNYPIKEYFLEDICQEIPSLVVSGPPPTSFNRGGGGGRNNNGMVRELRNPWATAEAVRARYHELGLRVDDTDGRRRGDGRIWKTLSNALQRPFQLDANLICEVMVHIEESEEVVADGSLGSVLIFVPGWQEITSVVKELENTLKDCRSQRHDWARGRSWNILPLHSMVPQKDQMKIFDSESPYSGRRKIIVSTSLAETSITVEDVVYVIDPGLTKSTTYSAHTNIASLETMQISRSNVQQRRGRAGRCRPGTFFKLYTQYEFLHEMNDHELPEMLRTPVEELCLQAKALRLPGDLPVQKILEKAINPPVSLAITNAVELLTELGAFGASEDMTPLGWRLSQLPVHPCLGKMLLLGSLFTRYSSRGNSPSHDQLLPLISICSTLSFKSPFVLPFGKEKEADRARKNYGRGLFSDHMLFAKVASDYSNRKGSHRGDFAYWIDKNFLSRKTLEQTEKIQVDLERLLKDLKVNDATDFVSSKMGKQTYHQEMLSRPLLSAILAASLSISFSSPTSRKLCSLRGGAACSVHPSSLLSDIESSGNERMLWRKYKHLMTSRNNDKVVEEFVLDSPDKIFVVGWFERLKTSDVYLRDCSLFTDPLPLLLLLPGIKQRGISSRDNQKTETKNKYADDPTIFEVLGSLSSQGGDSHNQAAKDDSTEPTLLLKVQDEPTARLFNSLRTKLFTFFGAVLSKGTSRRQSESTEGNIRAVFRGLENLLELSHSLYMIEGGNDTRMMDPDVLEVRHLHNSAHCVTLDPDKADDEDGVDEMVLDDDMDDYNQDRGNNSWGSSDRDWNRNNWHGGRGRGKRGRGRSWGRHGGAKRGRGSHW